MLATTYLFDVVDTLLKGEAHFERFGNEYMVRTVLFVTLCVVAMATRNRVFHAAFVAFGLIYQISWIWRLFDTPG